MRTLRPGWPLAAVALTLLLVGPFVTAGSALAAEPQVTVVGGAAIPTHAPGTDEVSYVISVGDGPAAPVVLHARQPAGLPADPTGVVIDGAAAPPGTVEQAGPGLLVRLGSGADATHGGSLATGNHTVTFEVAVNRLPTGSASASAVVDYLVDGRARHARSLPIPLALPDLRLAKPAGSGENRTLPLGTGVDGDFEAILTNPGGDTTAATLTITLPPGLGIDRAFGIYRDDQYRSAGDSGGVRLHCSSPQPTAVRCALGPVESGTNALIDVPVQPTTSAPAGRSGTFTVSALSGNLLEANPADNAVSGTVRFTGTAHLAVRLAPHKLKVTVGKIGKLTATIHNNGPNRAVQALGLIELRGDHFTITRFSGKQLSATSGGIGLARTRWARSATTATAAATARGVPLVLWKAGTIRPGGAVHATVTLKAIAAGRDELLLGADSAAGNPPCQRDVPTPQCKAFTFAALRAVKRVRRHRPAALSSSPAAPDSVAPSSRTGPARTAGPILAETGPRSAGAITAAGVGAIAAGSVFVALGTTRRGLRAR